MNEKEVVEVKVKLPERTYRALEYYVPMTGYWVSNESKDESISEWIADAAKEWLKMEAREPKDAIDSIKRELNLILDIEEKPGE